MMEARYIPHASRGAFEADGWEVKEISLPHGYYSLLAVREVSWFRRVWEWVRR
jgi:hypothetical protein